MLSVKKETICEGINFTYIPDDKFKTALLCVSLFDLLDSQRASENAILPSLLSHSCKNYKSLSEISKRLEELYGAEINSSISKLGDVQVLTFLAQSINNNLALEEKNNILDLTSLLCSMIFDPDTENGKFKKSNVDQEKRQLIEYIESEVNDKKLYARRRCEELMCKNEKFGIHPAGKAEKIEELNGESIFLAWQRLLSSAKIEILLIGKASYEPIIKEFKKCFLNIKRKYTKNYETQIIKRAASATEYSEHMDVKQCKLVMGMRTATANPDEKTDAVKVMNALFGGTAQSKLFLNVREKLSLCYYCASRYDSQKGILFIESGVEPQNIEKAKSEILNQLKEIKLGNFSDTELKETKLFLTQSTEKVKDSLSAMGIWNISQTFLENKKTPDETIEKINKVTREEVIDAANKLTLDTVYTLSGKEE